MKHLTAWLCVATLTALSSPLFAGGDCRKPCGSAGAMETGTTVSVEVSKDIVDTAVEAGSFRTLVAAVKAAGLVETLKGDGPFTVFAPTDRAFEALPAGTVEALLEDLPRLRSVLTYHVVPGRLLASDVVKSAWLETVLGQALKVRVEGDGAFVDGARIVKTDIVTRNGIIHVIDAVVLPRKDIVATAVEAKMFEKLVTAVRAAGLVETLKSKGPFTVFAPSDAAFAKLPRGTLEALLEDEAALKKLLTLHVVPGRVLSTDLPQGHTTAKTASGAHLRIERLENGEVRANGARVVRADVLAGNGVIHVIDTVILPE